MGQEKIVGKGIYDPETDSVISVEEANAKLSQPRTKLGISGPNGQFAGIDLPAEGVSEANADILKALPQIAGLMAQFTPVGRAGMKGAAFVPMAVDAIQQLIHGDGFDPMRSAQEGLEGMVGHGTGKMISGIGKAGTGVVRRSLGISGDYANRTAEELLPKLAIKEGASMTKEGVDRIAAKADQTGLGLMDDLAHVLENARMNDSLGKNFQGGGVMSAIMHLISPPKQLKIGQAMAAPFGADTEKTLAPAGEAGLRSLMAYLESLVGGSTPEPPTEAPGPQRRPLR